MGRHLDEGPRGSGVQVLFVSEVARSATVLHQPLIEPDDVKWRFAGQGATTVLNCAAQADIVRAVAAKVGGADQAVSGSGERRIGISLSRFGGRQTLVVWLETARRG